MTRRPRPVLLGLLTCLLATASCGGAHENRTVQMPPHAVGPEGARIAVEEPGGPLHGLTIDVPAGAFPEERTFTISHRPYEGESSPEFTPLTPLIRVEHGGGFANEVMIVTIPVEVPESMFAMGFLLDSERRLEPLPLVDLTPKSITVATRHFSDLIVGAISLTMLEGIVETGFRPGRDDWQFGNRGSYISPGGHCAGQSLTAAWYFIEKRLKKGPKLHGRYDNNGNQPTPEVWEDDSLGYRLASTVQKDVDFGNDLRKGFNALSKVADALTWKAFLYSLRLTHEPQYVSIRDEEGGGGHALVAYAADTEKGILYVADPNYPGDTTRGILYSNGRFLPYRSGDDIIEILLGLTKSYEQIRFNAKTALVSWAKLAERWSEFEKGTIGNDRFPEYELFAMTLDMEAGPLPDRLKTRGETLAVTLDTEAEGPLMFRVRRNGSWTAMAEVAEMSLSPGVNRLGFHITGKDKWLDFRWVEVERIVEEEAEETPRDETDPAPPGDAVIGGVYYGQLKTNSRSSGMMLFITSADGKIVLPNPPRILYEKQDEFGNVVETGFRFEKGFGSPAIRPGRWRVCAGSSVGDWRDRSEVVTVGSSGTHQVVVGAPPR